MSPDYPQMRNSMGQQNQGRSAPIEICTDRSEVHRGDEVDMAGLEALRQDRRESEMESGGKQNVERIERDQGVEKADSK